MHYSALLILATAAAGASAGAAATSTTAARAAAATSHCYLSVKAKAGDTCASIAAVFNLDAAAFRRMNPSVTDCAHLVVGNTYCVADNEGLPGGPQPSLGPSPKPAPSSTPAGPSPLPSSTPVSPLPPVPTPSPHQSPITPNCRKWYRISTGDTCAAVERAQGISDASFRTWNGFINSDCSNLWLGYYCCVGV